MGGEKQKEISGEPDATRHMGKQIETRKHPKSWRQMKGNI
jgi:hypothetical protein